jgi:N-acyl amino acid synthase of PEP-CTERM/exosortase system
VRVPKASEGDIVNESLRGLYQTYFDIRCDIGGYADLLYEALRLRFQVYCLEQGYEDAAAFPDGMERDSYDARSLHALLIHRTSRLVAGTVRLIRPDPAQPIGSLPIDHLCSDPQLREPGLLPRESLAEVSRFAISKSFRRRVEDAPTPTGVGPGWRERRRREQRRVPHLSLGLVQAMVCTSAQYGITHWVAEMEPALLRMYAKLGIHWHPMGDLIEFHGSRQPCWTRLDEMLLQTYRERPDVWDLVTNGGAYQCAPILEGWALPESFGTDRPPAVTSTSS